MSEMTDKENKKIVLHGALQLKDFLTYNTFHTRKRLIIAPLIPSAVGLILFALLGVLSHIGIIIFLIGVAIVTGGLGYLIIRFNAKRAFVSDALIKLEQELIIDEQAIQIKTQRTDSRFLWEDFTKAFEYKDLLLLYVSDARALVLPIRYFQERTDLVYFKITVNKKLNLKSHISISLSEEMEYQKGRQE